MHIARSYDFLSRLLDLLAFEALLSVNDAIVWLAKLSSKYQLDDEVASLSAMRYLAHYEYSMKMHAFTGVYRCE